MVCVMLFAAILSVTPGFVCGMEEVDLEARLSHSLQGPKAKFMEKILRMGANIKKDVKKKRKKLLRDLVEECRCCPEPCANCYATCEAVGSCECMTESFDRFWRERNCENGCPLGSVCFCGLFGCFCLQIPPMWGGISHSCSLYSIIMMSNVWAQGFVSYLNYSSDMYIINKKDEPGLHFR